MKILLVNTFYHPQVYGGVERMVKRLADALLTLGHTPVVACIGEPDSPRLDEVDGVRVHRLALRNVYPLLPVERRPSLLKPLWHAIDSANPWMQAALSDVVRLEQPAVAHTHNLTGFSTLAWSALADHNVPIVHTVHDHYLLCPSSTMFRDGANCERQHLSCRLYSASRIRQSARVSAVVGVSNYALRRHREFGAFNAVPIQQIIGNPTTGRAAAPQSSSNGTLRLGVLGRIEPAKGVEVLLEAVSGLKPGWTLDVAGAGDPDYVSSLRRRFPNTAIRFLGTVDSVAFFANIDLLVVPSRSNDTFGMVTAEAYAAGVPVIVTRRGGLPEIVREGETGRIVASDNAGDLRAAIARVLDAPQSLEPMRAQCREAGRAFEPATIARQYERVYIEVDAARRAPAA